MYISLASGNTSSNRKPEKGGVKSENRQGGTRQQAGGRQAQTTSQAKGGVEQEEAGKGIEEEGGGDGIVRRAL